MALACGEVFKEVLAKGNINASNCLFFQVKTIHNLIPNSGIRCHHVVIVIKMLGNNLKGHIDVEN